MKKLVVVAMIFLLGTAWWSTIDNFGVKKADTDSTLQQLKNMKNSRYIMMQFWNTKMHWKKTRIRVICG